MFHTEKDKYSDTEGDLEDNRVKHNNNAFKKIPRSTVNKSLNESYGSTDIMNKKLSCSLLNLMFLMISFSYMLPWTSLGSLISYYKYTYDADFYVLIYCSFYLPGLPVALLQHRYDVVIDSFISSQTAYFWRGVISYICLSSLVFSLLIFGNNQSILPVIFASMGALTWYIHGCASMLASMFHPSAIAWLQTGFRCPEIYTLLAVASLEIGKLASPQSLFTFYILSGVFTILGLGAWSYICFHETTVFYFQQKDYQYLKLFPLNNHHQSIATIAKETTQNPPTDEEFVSLLSQHNNEINNDDDNNNDNTINSSYTTELVIDDNDDETKEKDDQKLKIQTNIIHSSSNTMSLTTNSSSNTSSPNKLIKGEYNQSNQLIHLHHHQHHHHQHRQNRSSYYKKSSPQSSNKSSNKSTNDVIKTTSTTTTTNINTILHRSEYNILCTTLFITLFCSIFLSSFFAFVNSTQPDRNIEQILYFIRLFSDLIGRPLTRIFRPWFINTAKDLLIMSILRIGLMIVFFLYILYPNFPQNDVFIMTLVGVFSMLSGKIQLLGNFIYLL